MDVVHVGRLRATLVMLAVSAISMAACSADPPQGIASSDVGNGPSTADTAAAGTDGAASDPDGTAAVADPDGAAATPEPGAALTTAISSSLERIELTTVQIVRQDDTLRVDFTLLNTSDGSQTWTNQLATTPFDVGDLGLPTGLRIIDPSTATVVAPLQLEDDGGCICSPLGSLSAGESGAYFVTFAGVDSADFELYVPTFPLLPVRTDAVQAPSDLPTTGLAPATASTDGLTLDALAATRRGGWTLLEFQITNAGDGSHTFTNHLARQPFSVADIARPTGITLFDPSAQAQAEVAEVELAPCACSQLGSLRAGETGSYFVFLEPVEAAAINVAIPTFPLVSSLPIQG